MMVKWYKVTGLRGWRGLQVELQLEYGEDHHPRWVAATGDPAQDDLALVQIIAEDEHACDAEMRSQMDDGLFENNRGACEEPISDRDMIGWLNSAWELYDKKTGIMKLECKTGNHYVETLASYLRDTMAQYGEVFGV